MTEACPADSIAPDWAARVRIVLVQTSLPRNIGSAARAMRTMGLSRLVLVAPERFPDPDASALASGADDVLERALVVPDLAQALAGCVAAYGASARRRDIVLPELDARGAGQQAVQQVADGGEVALVFGSERVGLTNAQIALCQFLVCIPTAPDFSSLNLAAAVQLLAYECRMAALGLGLMWQGRPRNQLPPARRRNERPATLDQLEGYFGHLQQVLGQIGFFGDRAPDKLMRRLRVLYLRANPSEREVQILRGILSETQRCAGRSAE